MAYTKITIILDINDRKYSIQAKVSNNRFHIFLKYFIT